MFVSVDSAIQKIEDLTRQKCNLYTLLHYVSNGYKLSLKSKHVFFSELV